MDPGLVIPIVCTAQSTSYATRHICIIVALSVIIWALEHDTVSFDHRALTCRENTAIVVFGDGSGGIVCVAIALR